MKYVNIYRDPEAGEHDRYISSADYKTYEEAYSMRDDVSTYIETVGILRNEELEEMEKLLHDIAKETNKLLGRGAE